MAKAKVAFKWKPGAAERLAQQVGKKVGGQLQRELDELYKKHSGGDSAVIARDVKAMYRRNGWTISDAQARKHADVLAAGRPIKVQVSG